MDKLGFFAAPGRYVQGRNATAQLGSLLQKLAIPPPVLILASKSGRRHLDEVWQATLPAAGYSFEVLQFGGESTVAEIERVAAVARASGAKAVIGAGGGKVLDTAKAAADRLGLPVVCCPTVASSDAPCSAVGVVYSPEGVFDHVRFFKRHPNIVLVDTSVIAQAPKRMLVAGIGDALATFFEARTTHENHGPNFLGGKGLLTGIALAELCYKTLLENAEAACAAVEAKAVTPALERIVEANTLLSGLGFEAAGTAVAHSVHDGLTVAPGAHAYLHGEKVAFGTVTQLVLEGRPKDELDTVYRFCCRVGLPVTLAQVGVDASDAPLLLACAEKAAAEGSPLHVEPFEVTPAMVRDAMLAADLLGRRYLAEAAGGGGGLAALANGQAR